MSTSAPLLRVSDLRLSYHTPGGDLPAVDGVSFSLLRGQALGLVGESGAGKSSLALALMRLLPRNVARLEGSVELEGTECLALGEENFRRQVRWRKVSMVFQGAMDALNPVLRVGEQVAEPMAFHQGLPRQEALREAARWLAVAQLPEELGHRYPHELSGGMKQRVLLAMAMVLRPQVVILDEPTSALDVTIQAQLLDQLKELKREMGLSFLFITHDIALASDLCDAIGVMYGGKLVELGPAERVLLEPRHPYTQMLLASVPRLRQEHPPSFIPGAPPDPLRPPAGCQFHPRCPYVFPRCRQEEPPLLSAGGDQQARCWLLAEARRPPIAAEERPTEQGTPVLAGERPARQGTPVVTVEQVAMEFHARQGLLRTVPIRALDGVSLAARPGETVAIVGESGSGKTTLARVCLRLLRPTEGKVLFHDTDLTRLPERRLKSFRRRAQGVFQDPFSSLDPYMNVGQIVEEPLHIHGVDADAGPGSAGSRTARQMALWALDQVKLNPPEAFAIKYPHTLSGGQRQRVAIARALVLRPELVVADEPVSMIDASSRAEILELLRELQRRHGTAFFYITHDIATAAHFSHHLAVMYLGRVVEEGPTASVIAAPLHPYTQALMAAVPEPDPANRLRRRTVARGEPPSPASPPAGCRFHPRCPQFMAGLCDVVDPPLREVRPGHRAACHLWGASPKGEG